MSKTLAEKLAEFVVDLQFSDLPEDVVRTVKVSTLDDLGVMIAASEEPCVKIALDLARRNGGSPESTIFVHGDKVPATSAAFVNGIACHSLELDDHISHKRSLNHPGVVTIPPALALGECYGVSGQDYLLAAVLGYDVTCRVNNAVSPGFFNFERGFHGTAITGTFGSAALTGKMMGATADQIATAFGICGSLTAGSSEFKATGAWTKRLHAGNASKNGIIAATLAKGGFTGPHTVFEGSGGFYKSFAGEGNYNLEAVTKNLGTDYEVRYIQYKPYSSSGVMHSPMTAARKLVDKYSLRPEDIKHLKVITSSKMVKEYCEPRERKINPQNSVDAQFSLIYAIAALLCKGKYLIDEYSEDALKDQRTLDLCKKIECVGDPAIDKEWPQNEPSRVIITTYDGRELEMEVNAAKGSLEDPMTEAEIIDKFRGLTNAFLEKDTTEKLIELCMNLEKEDNIRILAETVQKGVNARV